MVRTLPSGRTLTTTVDEHGRPVAIKVPGAPELKFSRDAEGRVVSTMQGEGASVRVANFAYSAAGALESMTDTLGARPNSKPTWADACKVSRIPAATDRA